MHEDFTARYPDIGTLAQESGLDDAARAAFLEQFGPSPAKTLLGFGVMGGIFGEGVDLVGDRLIGCAIVGVGLPQVNPRQEILRRYFKCLCEQKITGTVKETERYKLELLMNQADLTVGQREVEKQAHARSESTGGAPAAAIELPDGTVVTGKTGPLLGAAASALMNALKVLAGIPQETDLVSAASIEPIQTLKTNYLGSKNPRLHTDEILIALSSSAAQNPTAAAALKQLSHLKGCDMHSTVILSSVDMDTVKKLGMYLTCEPTYEEADRMYHKK